MAVLDTILIEELISGPVTVNSEFVSRSIDISYKEAESSIQTVYSNGVNVNMKIILEVSNDDVNFAPITDSEQVITDATGTDIIDIFGTGTNYLRIKIEVTTGSIDLQSIVWKGKRRH